MPLKGGFAMNFWTFALVALLAALATTALCMWVISHHNKKLFTAIKKFVVESLPEIRIKTEAYQKLRAEVLAEGSLLLGDVFKTDHEIQTLAVGNISSASRLFDGFDYKQLWNLGLGYMVGSTLDAWSGEQGERLSAYRQKVDQLKDEIELIREASEICIE